MFGVLYVGMLLLALLLETNPLLFTVGAGLRLDLTLLVVVYGSLFWGGERASVLGFLAGLCQDALSSEVFGLQALSKSVVAFVIQALCTNVQVHSVIAQSLFTGLAISLDTVIRAVVLSVLHGQTVAFTTVCSLWLQQTLVSMVLAPAAYQGWQALVQQVQSRQEKGPRHGAL